MHPHHTPGSSCCFVLRGRHRRRDATRPEGCPRCVPALPLQYEDLGHMCRHVCRHMRRHVLAGPMANLCAVTHVIPIEPPRHFGSKGLSPFQAALHVPEAPPQAPPPRAWCGRVHLCTGVCAVVRSETSNKPLWRAVSVSDFRVPASLATYSSGAIVRHLCIHVWRLFLSGGMAILTVADMEAAGRALQRSTGCRAVLVKGATCWRCSRGRHSPPPPPPP